MVLLICYIYLLLMYQLMFGLIYSVSLAREKINHQLVITAGTQIPTKILSEAFDPEDKTLCDVQTVPDRLNLHPHLLYYPLTAMYFL